MAVLEQRCQLQRLSIDKAIHACRYRRCQA